MRCVVLELVVRGKDVPTPPGSAKVTQTPGRAQVKRSIRDVPAPGTECILRGDV